MKIWVVALIFAFVPTWAAQADDDIGCGVGTMVMEGKEGVPFKVLGSFINGITFSSVSITFGLLNCDTSDGTVTADAREIETRHFASNNFDGLVEEMAAGGGERLDVLAHLLEIPVENRDGFAAMTQREFETLYPHDQVTVGEMLTALDGLMAENGLL
jgi:hypothetical protein